MKDKKNLIVYLLFLVITINSIINYSNYKKYKEALNDTTKANIDLIIDLMENSKYTAKNTISDKTITYSEVKRVRFNTFKVQELQESLINQILTLELPKRNLSIHSISLANDDDIPQLLNEITEVLDFNQKSKETSELEYTQIKSLKCLVKYFDDCIGKFEIIKEKIELNDKTWGKDFERVYNITYLDYLDSQNLR